MIRVATCLSAFAFLAASAHADKTADITGIWNFSANIGDGCDFTGQATLRPSQDTSETDYVCELTARQSCTTGLDYIVRQSCKVRNTRGQVSLRANIEEFIEGDPTPYYYPDNFTLSVKSDSEMYGALLGGGGARPSTWVRADGSIS